MWPFGRKEKRLPSRNAEIEELRLSVSADRYERHRSLIRLDDATKAIDSQGARGMLTEMFQRLDEGKRRG